MAKDGFWGRCESYSRPVMATELCDSWVKRNEGPLPVRRSDYPGWRKRHLARLLEGHILAASVRSWPPVELPLCWDSVFRVAHMPASTAEIIRAKQLPLRLWLQVTPPCQESVKRGQLFAKEGP